MEKGIFHHANYKVISKNKISWITKQLLNFHSVTMKMSGKSTNNEILMN